MSNQEIAAMKKFAMTRMTPGGQASRWLVSALHVCCSLTSGASVLTALHWTRGTQLSCLPPVVDACGDSASSLAHSLEGACHVITWSSGVVCALNLLLVICLNGFWGSWGALFAGQALTAVLCLVSVGSSTALTVDFALWCSSLENNAATNGCEDAARDYNLRHTASNMTAYFRKMEIQQAYLWAVVPFTLCAVLLYSYVMKDLQHHSVPQPQGAGGGRRVAERPEKPGRYRTLLADEESSLVAPHQLLHRASSTSTSSTAGKDDVM